MFPKSLDLPGRLDVAVARLRSAWLAFRTGERGPLIAAAICVALVAATTVTAVARQRSQEARWVAADAAPSALPVALGADLTADFTLTPEEVRPLEQDEARRFNAGLPFSTLPILAAKPFIMAPDNLVSYSRALDCLTAAVYYEAASETGPGQAAVAQVVLNRMRHPAYPSTVCGVVFQGSERTTGCQFTFTCDGALARRPSEAGWARARAVAAAALNGAVAAEVGMATHYHTDWVAPYWAERLVKMRQIGTHIFYRWTGAWGLPFAFTSRHGGEEPVTLKLAALTTPLELLPAPEDGLIEALSPASLPPIPTAAIVVAAPEPLDIGEPSAVETEVEMASPAPTPAPVVVRAPIIADPLARSADAPPARRARIAAPSGW